MKSFQHTNAASVTEAAAALSDAQSRLIAGGTDLMGTLKDNILPIYPKKVVNLKTIPGLDYIKEEGGTLKIGALTRVEDLADSALIKERFTAIAQAASRVASPHIRSMGTIGGNISQLPRCWYFRKGENRFNCNRKGGEECYAILGDNRYHSAFGGSRCHNSPCTSECPAGTDIPGYFAEIRKGDWDAAARIIMKVNPLPVVTARVCAHFCQGKCNRCQTDESVTISGVERTLGDYILEHSDTFYAPPASETGKSVAIVGSGPAGLSAAFYLRKAGNKVTVYETQPEAGGMLMYAIPAYRMPKDIVRKLIKAFENMGIVFKTNTKLGVDVQPEDLEKQYDSVCYATGTWKRPVAGLSGEELTVFGLDFLVQVKDWMNGKVGEEVFVMGGGNVAMDVALTAKRLGAKKVTLACLEPRDRMPASSEEVARVEEEGVIVLPSWGLSKVVEANGIVKGMELKRCVSPWDETGRFNPQYDENEKLVVEAQNLLMAIGQSVDLSFLYDKYQVQLTQRGLIDVAADSQMTSREGVFAAGDATMGPGTTIRAIANGHKAASGMLQYLEVVAPAEVPAAKAFIHSDAEGIKVTQGLKIAEVALKDRQLEVEDSFSPSAAEAVAEASRCLNCGCYAVSPSDIAPTLVALSAKIVTNKRTLAAEAFFEVNTLSNTSLEYDEIITEIQVPALPKGAKSYYKKLAFRKAIDFPVVSVAVVTGDAPRVVLGAVAPTPYRAVKAEKILAGKAITEDLAEQAGAAALEDAHPFEATAYKIQIGKTLVKRALLATV